MSAWRIATPCRLELIGPSQSGKSTLILSLVGDDSVWDRPFAAVMYAAPLLSDREPYLNDLRDRCRRTGKRLLLREGQLPAADEVARLSEGAPTLLICDDLLCFEDLSPLDDLTTMHSHHLGLSCAFCVQNPFFRKGKVDLVTASRNVTGRFVLYQRNDWLCYKLLNARLFPDAKDFLLDALDAARNRHNRPYVYINCHSFSELPRRYMVYTSLFEGERVAGSPVFFDLDDRRAAVKGDRKRGARTFDGLSLRRYAEEEGPGGKTALPGRGGGHGDSAGRRAPH